jgi:hypothetical protein
MSVTVDQAFIKQYESEVHMAYQRQGSKFRGLVRTKDGIKGASTTFQKVGRGAASTKARHGQVPVMNIDHSPVECLLSDHYAGDFVDKLDELKINIDERQVTANAGAYALGRKTDEIIIASLASAGASRQEGDGTLGLTRARCLAGLELLNGGDVPDDGMRFASVGVHQWSELMCIKEFASADYVGTDLPFLKSTIEKRFWMGVWWFQHSGLPLAAGVRSCFLWHKTAVGHAIGQDVTIDITWQGLYAAHFIDSMMSQGACLIDNLGAVEWLCDDDEALPA